MQITFITILFYIVFLVFIAGVILFVLRYRESKLKFEQDKLVMNEKHLREVVQAKLESQQLTMQDIGQEIHDSVGQKLTLASLYTQQLLFMNSMPDAKSQLNNISDIINESLTELRSLSKSLTGQQLQQGNLVKLLELECERINASGACMARLEASKGIKMVAQPMLNMVLRLLQEFMQNSLKHAGCKHIVISLSQVEATLTITATDDGKGFDVAALEHAGKGIGIANMRRRANLMGANLALESNEGQGTTLILSVAL